MLSTFLVPDELEPLGVEPGHIFFFFSILKSFPRDANIARVENLWSALLLDSLIHCHGSHGQPLQMIPSFHRQPSSPA